MISQFLWAKNPGQAYLGSLFHSLSQTAIVVSAGAHISSEGLIGEEPTCVLTYIVVGRIEFLKAFWTEVLKSLLAVGCSCLESILSSLSWGLSNMASGFIKARRESANKTQVTNFCELIMGIISHQLSLILSVRKKSLSPAYTQEEG